MSAVGSSHAAICCSKNLRDMFASWKWEIWKDIGADRRIRPTVHTETDIRRFICPDYEMCLLRSTSILAALLCTHKCFSYKLGKFSKIRGHFQFSRQRFMTENRPGPTDWSMKDGRRLTTASPIRSILSEASLENLQMDHSQKRRHFVLREYYDVNLQYFQHF